MVTAETDESPRLTGGSRPTTPAPVTPRAAYLAPSSEAESGSTLGGQSEAFNQRAFDPVATFVEAMNDTVGPHTPNLPPSPGVDCRPAMWQSVGKAYTSNIR